jgi:hypothetical protein
MEEPMDLGPVLHLMHSFLPRHEFVVLEGASRTGWGAQFSTGEKCSVFTRRRQQSGGNTSTVHLAGAEAVAAVAVDLSAEDESDAVGAARERQTAASDVDASKSSDRDAHR